MKPMMAPDVCWNKSICRDSIRTSNPPPSTNSPVAVRTTSVAVSYKEWNALPNSRRYAPTISKEFIYASSSPRAPSFPILFQPAVDGYVSGKSARSIVSLLRGKRSIPLKPFDAPLTDDRHERVYALPVQHEI